MTIDFDDFSDGNHKLDRVFWLKEINPLFRCTMFAVPGLCSEQFLDSLPRWIELAVHGWTHPHSRECEQWERADIERCLDSPIVKRFFVNGWKSPGWQTSPAIYEVLAERGWWIADQHLADDIRPEGLRVYLHEDGENWHGHIQDWGSNGIDETWAQLCETVRDADSFRFASEMAKPWKPVAVTA